MKFCCFCFNPKRGTLATAIFGLVTKTFAIIALSIAYGVIRQANSDYYRHWKNSRYGYNNQFDASENERSIRAQLATLDGGFIPSIIETSISILCCILLILGAAKGNKSLFWPWFVFTGLEIIGGFISIAVLFVLSQLPLGRLIIVIVGIVTAFQVYCFRCVIAHYRDLKLMSSRTRGMVISIPYQHMAQANEGQSAPHIVNVHSQPGTSLGYVISPTQNPPDYTAATLESQTKS